MNELVREYHEISMLFPLMQGEEFENLKADISKNGLREPIWIHTDGRIIDGRNRHRACIETGVPPKFRTWENNGSLVSFVISLNLHRRHLTPSQKAVIALNVQEQIEAEILEGKRAVGKFYADKQWGNESGMGFVKIDETHNAPRDSREEAAKIVGVSAGYISQAKRIQENNPELIESVKSGAISIAQTSREVVKQERRQVSLLPSAKYRIIYADPPWKYGNDGIINNDNYGHTARHYPSMSIKELCELGEQIQPIIEKDAVLFLWVTSPILAECWPVITAWGFIYKSSFVWDKVLHNFGHYNSMRHEFLLVCTKGSCTPDTKELHDSVISIEKSNKHSEKPEQFRQLIDKLYPSGKRIELFARTKAEGWDTWGNEPKTY